MTPVVRDFMVSDVFELRPETTLREAIEQLLSRSLSGAPVVNEDDTIAGFVTERDIVNKVKEDFVAAGLPLHLSLFDAIFLYDNQPGVHDKFENEVHRLSVLKVKDVMWKNVIVVKPEDNIEVALYYLSKYRINRMPVVENDKIIGLISRTDILDGILKIISRRESNEASQP